MSYYKFEYRISEPSVMLRLILDLSSIGFNLEVEDITGTGVSIDTKNKKIVIRHPVDHAIPVDSYTIDQVVSLF